jgi:hypothetical protein
MATTASTALRAAATGVRIVLIASMALIALLVLIVSSVRPCLRERWNDRQSENDGSDEDGFAKNVSSRRVCELKRVFHGHCSSVRARHLAAQLSAYKFPEGVTLRSLPHYLIGGVRLLAQSDTGKNGAARIRPLKSVRIPYLVIRQLPPSGSPPSWVPASGGTPRRTLRLVEGLAHRGQ